MLYHSVQDMSGFHKDYLKINLKTALFQSQMKAISNIKSKNITVTFDDGFVNFFEIVLPIISEQHIKTILFVTSGFIDGVITFDSSFGNEFHIKPLSWKQIKEISQSGVEIGSHSITHRNLTTLDKKDAFYEIMDSKKRIEDIIGRQVRYFAYPFGGKNAFNNSIKDLVKKCGYEKAYINIMGFNNSNSDPYELRRIRIYNDDMLFNFKLKIKGVYNWIDRLNTFFCLMPY